MDILQSLKQLRDDIKTWVTNNLNALNAKIDEKTIPIDNELSSTSTNPVQNKIIKKAIDNIPKFSGDYNDLTNAPNISEDESGNMIIADESGNIIFKADVDGIHTTAVSLNGEAAASQKYVDEAIANADVDLTGYATEDFVTTAVDSAKAELSESIITESEDWKIVDNDGNIIFSIDNAGVHTTDLTLNGEKAATEAYVDEVIANIDFPEANLSDYYTKEQTDEAIKTVKEEISETITSESNEWKVVDNAGNIIFSVDASGAHTTELTLNDKAAATEEYVDEAIAAIPKVSLDGYATENYVDTKVADLGAGDMLKSVYDVDNDGIVDKAKALNIENVGNRDIDDIIEPGVYYYLPYDEDHPQSVHWPDPENHEGFLEVFGQDNYSDALIQKVVSFDSFAYEPKIRIYWRSILDIERNLWKGWQREELDYNDLINKPTIPTKTSELTNDKKFITIGDLDYQLISYEDIDFLVDNGRYFYCNYDDSIPPSGMEESWPEDSHCGFLEVKNWEGNCIQEASIFDYSSNTIRRYSRIFDDCPTPEIFNWFSWQRTDFSGDYNHLTNKPAIPSVIDNLTSSSTTDALSAAQGQALKKAIDSITTDLGDMGGGDMMKATYDTDGDGIVDNSSRLEGHAASYFAQAEHEHDQYLTELPEHTHEELMSKSVYDKDNDGIIDKAGALNIKELRDTNIDSLLESGTYYYDETSYSLKGTWPDNMHCGYLEVIAQNNFEVVQKITEYYGTGEADECRFYYRRLEDNHSDGEIFGLAWGEWKELNNLSEGLDTSADLGKTEHLFYVDRFVSEMNRLSSSLGMTNSVFKTPSGLNCKPISYGSSGWIQSAKYNSIITAHDLLRLMVAVYHAPGVMKVLTSGRHEYRLNDIAFDVINSVIHNDYNRSVFNPLGMQVLGGKGGSLNGRQGALPNLPYGENGILNMAYFIEYNDNIYATAAVGLNNYTADSEERAQEYTLLRHLMKEMILKIEDPSIETPYIEEVQSRELKVGLAAVKLTGGTFDENIALLTDTNPTYCHMNEHEPRAAASVAKLLTALVCASNFDNHPCSITFNDMVGGSGLQNNDKLNIGDKITTEDAMYLMLYLSDNAMATMLSRDFGKRVFNAMELGTNPVLEDTPAAWIALGNGVAYINDKDEVVRRPVSLKNNTQQFGIITNKIHGDYITQEWQSVSLTTTVYHRSGTISGWYGENEEDKGKWVQVLDANTMPSEIDAVSEIDFTLHCEDESHTSEAQRARWDAKSDFSGDYQDLTNAPSISEDENDLLVVDKNGNIVFRINADGLEATKFRTEELVVNGKQITGDGSGSTSTGGVLPECTTADNGKILCVVNGVPTWVSIPNAEEASF